MRSRISGCSRPTASGLPTHGHQRVSELATAAYVQACLRLPWVRYVGDEDAQAVVDGLETLTRYAVTGGAIDGAPPDRQVLIGHLQDLVDDAAPSHWSAARASGLSAATAPIYRGTEVVQEGEYLTDAFAREAVAFIERHQKRPFFLYLPFNAVHTPMHATDKRLERFASISDPMRRTYSR